MLPVKSTSKKLAELQREFTAYLRNPSADTPAGIHNRAATIYSDLVFSNIESFLTSFFPVLHQVLSAGQWHQLARQFVQNHQCQTPYFLEISQEFLQFLMANPVFLQDYPPYTLELAHYEWVELALDVSNETLPATVVDADVLQGFPQVSPLAWCLTYHYPVHLIGPNNIAPSAQMSHLVVYRNRQQQVKFLAANPLTLRLLQLLPTGISGGEACSMIASEIAHPQPDILMEEGRRLLQQLRELDIIVAINAGAEIHY